MWSDLATALGLPAAVGAAAAPTGPRLSITLTNRQAGNPVVVAYEARPATVRGNRELIASGNGKPAERSTRHVEIALTGGYRTGDHLGVLPRNGIDLVRRVITRFGLDAGQYLTIIPNSGGHTHLPIDDPHRCSACSAPAWSCRTSRAATTSRPSPATPPTPRRRPRSRS